MISGGGTSLITTLNISSVQPSDVGMYECRASIYSDNAFESGVSHLCGRS